MLRASALALVLLAACTPETPASPPRPVGSATNGPVDPLPPKKATKTIFVADALVDCEGEGPMKCMRTRESESAPWTLFYERIEGFAYEEGSTYELRVEVTEVPKPPADAPSRAYKLVEVVSKKPTK